MADCYGAENYLNRQVTAVYYLSMKHTRKRHGPSYFLKNLGTIVGIVLVWRGVWYTLDAIDIWLIGDYTHLSTALAGIVIGFLVLYLPDRDLKEIEKL